MNLKSAALTVAAVILTAGTGGVALAATSSATTVKASTSVSTSTDDTAHRSGADDRGRHHRRHQGAHARLEDARRGVHHGVTEPGDDKGSHVEPGDDKGRI